jgi:hypothetical protein
VGVVVVVVVARLLDDASGQMGFAFSQRSASSQQMRFRCTHLQVLRNTPWVGASVQIFQPTTQPTKPDVLHDFRVFRQSPRSRKSL